jgi:hypothetical protein
VGYRWLRATYFVDSKAASPATLGVKVVALNAAASIDPSTIDAECEDCARSSQHAKN